MKYLILPSILLFSICLNCQAQTSPSDSVEIESTLKELAKDCKNPSELHQSKYFDDLHKKAIAINEMMCNEVSKSYKKESTDLYAIGKMFSMFGLSVKLEMTEKFRNTPLWLLVADSSENQICKNNSGICNLANQAEYFERILGENSFRKLSNFVDAKTIILPVLAVDIIPNIKGNIYTVAFTGNQKNVVRFDDAENDSCSKHETLKVQCYNVLKDLEKSINVYRKVTNAYHALAAQKKLASIEKEWLVYWDAARSMTFLDLSLTSLIEGGDVIKSGHIAGPPEKQWFALHPNIVYEIVKGAPAGQRSKEALSIEWIGVNWWKNSPINIPFGISLSSLYADRVGVKTMGHGATFYFNNKYALGIVRRGGINGIFVSVDLLKAFESKEQNVIKFRKKVDTFIDAHTRH